MTTDYLELRNHFEERLTQFGHEIRGPMSGFTRLQKKAMEDGALSAKVKELMALLIIPMMRSRWARRGLSCWRRSV
jgi:alkylhydroperoxidase/carboxymuconolactone decarboxylase family protein YurZ